MSTFKDILKQSAKELRATRVDSIAENLEVRYDNEIRQLFLKIKDAFRAQNDVIINLYPDTTISTEIGRNFNAADFIKNDTQLLFDIRTDKIKLSILVKRYRDLFGKDCRDYEDIKNFLKDDNHAIE